jgi:hypothetical protein
MMSSNRPVLMVRTETMAKSFWSSLAWILLGWNMDRDWDLQHKTNIKKDKIQNTS